MRNPGRITWACLILAAAADAAAGPLCEPAETAVDFGRVSQFTESTRIVAVRNGGNTDLEIRSVRICCGFEAKLRTGPTIAPGGPGEIVLTCRPLLKTGAVQDALVIVSNDPARPVVSVPVAAEVIREFDLSPRAVNFGRVESEEQACRTLKIEPCGGGAIADMRLSYPEKVFGMLCRIPGEGAAERAVDVEISVRPGAPPGSFSTLVTGTCVVGGREKPLAFYVHGEVVPGIAVLPERVVLAGAAAGRTCEGHVRLVDRKGRPFSILSAACDNGAVAVQTQAVSEHEYIVLARYTATQQGSNFKALITLGIGAERDGKIEIPVLVLFEKK